MMSSNGQSMSSAVMTDKENRGVYLSIFGVEMFTWFVT